MGTHYSAFISYRHHPEDIRVAKEIQRLLEHFRVPGALKKRGCRISRVFRDKDELRLTTSLTDSITTALKNSEFLIVICSTHTAESAWVQQEIEAFLLTHDRSKVLTVLVEGESSEVIPDILLHQNVTDPETGETRQEILEPLSCDWRIARRRAHREELPRLAAMLLHCSYDELRQRQKQYKMQQLLAGGSVALALSLGLAAYFLYTSIMIRNANIQIQENYTQALRNQSQYLTTAAEDRMKNGDQLTALALLLEALPNEESQRPYVAEAEKILAEALGVYSAKGDMVARGALVPDEAAVVTDFVLTDDGSHIYLLDNRKIITVWDTQSLLLEATIDLGMTDCRLLSVTSAGELLLRASYGDSKNYVQCYQPDGTCLWQIEGYFNDLAFQGNKEVILGTSSTEDNKEILLFLDPSTGEQIRKPMPLSDEDGVWRAGFYFSQQQFAFGDSLILSYDGAVSWDTYDVHTYLVDPNTGEQKFLLLSKFGPATSYITEDGKAIIMTSDGGGQLNGNSSFSIVVTSPVRYTIHCYDQKSGEPLWLSEIVTCQNSGTYMLLPVPDCNKIFCQAGNTLQLINAADGNILQRCELPSAVCDVSELTQEYAYGVLMDGGFGRYLFQDNVCGTKYQGISSDLKQAKISNDLYTLAEMDSQVNVYHRQYLDTFWEEEMGTFLLDSCSSGDLLAFKGEDILCLYDLRNREYVWQQQCSYPDILGFSDDCTKLWTEEDDNLVAYDTVTGEKRCHIVPKKLKNNYVRIRGRFHLYRNQVWYLVSQDQTLYLAALSPETDEVVYYLFLTTGLDIPEELVGEANDTWSIQFFLDKKEHSREIREQANALLDACDEFNELVTNSRILSITEEHAWLLTGIGTVFALPLNGEEPVLVVDALANPVPIAHRKSDGITAISGKNCILFCAPNGQLIQTLDLDDDNAYILYFRGDELLCQTEHGYFLRFGSDGAMLSRIGNILVSSSYHSNLQIPWDQPLDISWHETNDGKLICYAFNTVNIIDCETWDNCGSLSCFMYYPAADVFLNNHSETIQAIHRYSLGELIQLAKQRIGNFALSQDKREAYGLDS